MPISMAGMKEFGSKVCTWCLIFKFLPCKTDVWADKGWLARWTNTAEFRDQHVIHRDQKHKAHGTDAVASDIVNLGRHSVFIHLNNFNKTQKTKQIHESWHDAKTIILFNIWTNKETPETLSTAGPLALCHTATTDLHNSLQTTTENISGCKSAKRTSRLSNRWDYQQGLNQMIEQSNEYNIPLCTGFIDNKKKKPLTP